MPDLLNDYSPKSVKICNYTNSKRCLLFKHAKIAFLWIYIYIPWNYEIIAPTIKSHVKVY